MQQHLPLVIEPLVFNRSLFVPFIYFWYLVPFLFLCSIWLTANRPRVAAPSLQDLLTRLRAPYLTDPDLWALLMEPPLRNLLAKLVYAQEWAASLEQSHPVRYHAVVVDRLS